jgi:trehalose 6-phosphate synthase
MASRIRFVAYLVAGLGVLASLAYIALTNTTRSWFERDVALRAQLAVRSAQRGLLTRMSAERQPELLEILEDITHDERVMGAAACSAEGNLIAATQNYPSELSCTALQLRMVEESASLAEAFTMVAEFPAGPVYVSSIPVGERGALGCVVLAQDMQYMVRREATTRAHLLVAFFVLAIAASVVTFLAARVARRGWIRDLRRALGGQASRDFQPLVRDVRDLVASLAHERESESRAGRWSAERLRTALHENLHDDQVVVVANREPYIHERGPGDQLRVIHPASGLVTALEPVMRACSGVWIAHGSGSADRETVDAKDRLRVPPDDPSYALRRVWLTREEEQGYYYGFSNEGLWPLCHVAHARPDFRAEDWQHYRAVNQRFADAVCQEVLDDEPIVLVQDYHFALAPKMIRQRLPRATILTFWHIPWPNAERFGICPWRDEILDGLLGSSILGFHTQQHCNQFFDTVDTYIESRIDREYNAVLQGKRRTLVRPYPISIEWPVRWLDDLPDVWGCRREVSCELGLGSNALLGVGVDRLDYTKGIEERFLAVEQLLARHPEFRGRFSFVQLAAPSRTHIERYKELNDRVEAVAARINAKWSRGSYKPIHLLRAHHEPPTVFRFMRAADLCYVSSLHDGMNLVAKEFVAARDDLRGVLVLSQFTGAAKELNEALIVNPYDLQQASDALATALRMSVEEQEERMRSMRGLVSELNVYRWAGRMLVDAAQLRRSERLAGRLAEGSAPRLMRRLENR